MSKTWDLRGVHLKLDRAETHIQTLRNETDAFLKRNPKPLGVRTDKTPRPGKSVHYVLYAVVRKDPPPELALIIGDVIHNLRSALEHLAHELSGRKKGSQFPIFTDKCRFKVIGIPRIKGVKDKERALIERVQPYVASNPRRSDPLAMINELSNLDKHRLPIPVVAAVNTTDSWAATGNADIQWEHFEPGPVKHDAKVLAFTATPKDPAKKMDVHPQSGLQVQLTDTGADDIYADMSAVAVLEMLHYHVKWAVVESWFRYGFMPRTWAEVQAASKTTS